MKSIQVSKNRVKEYLAEKLAKNVLQSEISDLVLVLRFNALGGFEFLSDEDLFENLIVAIPELDLLQLSKSDDNYLYLGVKPQNKDDEDDIIIDIQKILHIVF
ncbi:MAG TPA: hypothetical protein DIW31_12340 [Bacteroidales bacterium]|nr:hypothetical protein [Bacteroidales bacterium]